MLIDSHCHLDQPPLNKDLSKVVERAKLADIKYLLTISTDIESFKKIEKIVKNYENIFGTIGIHPHETKKYPNCTSSYLINARSNNKKIIGIGETGLDFFYNHSDKKIQKKIFLEHIHASIKLKLPLIVHSRNADKDTYDILQDAVKNYGLNKILLHCFTGSMDFAKKLLNIGAYISFSGIITFKKSNDLLNIAAYVPLNRLLIETDSPYLAPVPHRGKSNEPSFVTYTAEKIALIKKIDISEVEKFTSFNFLKLFSLK